MRPAVPAFPALAVLAAAHWLAGLPAFAGDGNQAIYRCDRPVPLFTNKASYGCEEYAPRAPVAVSPNATMFLGGVPESGQTLEASAIRQAEAIQHRVCELYDEWIRLNERTAGSLLYPNTQETARMQALAKIFSAIGAPVQQCRR